jgi:ribosomal protein L16 Arg81 hydroxylase
MIEFDNPLGWLLETESTDSFLSEYLNERYLVAGRPDPDRFAQLLSVAELDEILGTYGLRFPDVRMVRSDQDVPHTEYVWKDNLIDPMRAARLFSEGSTIIFNALQDRHGNVQRLCAAMSAESSMKAQANIYLTPPHAQGFNPHWDTHDVFVLQVSGTKDWRMYAGGPEHPMMNQKFDPERFSPGEVTAEFTLEAGQVLYIPRGIMHAAAATDETSLHITLGLIAYTWTDLARDAFAELAERSPEWRESLPWGCAREERGGAGALAEGLRQRLAGVVDQMDVAGLMAERVQELENGQRPRCPDHLRQAITAAALADEDAIAKRPGLSSRIERRGDRVAWIAAGREVVFPGVAERTLQDIAERGPVRFSDIDDDLDASGRRTVITKLIREGALARHEAGATLELEASNGN